MGIASAKVSWAAVGATYCAGQTGKGVGRFLTLITPEAMSGAGYCSSQTGRRGQDAKER